MLKLLWISPVGQVTFVRCGVLFFFFWPALLIKHFLPPMCTANARPWTLAPGKHYPFITWKITQISGATQRPCMWPYQGLQQPITDFHIPPGLCTYLRLRFALRLPWFWYLWKETSGRSALSSKEPLVSGCGWLFGLLRHGGEPWYCWQLAQPAERVGFLPQRSQGVP